MELCSLKNLSRVITNSMSDNLKVVHLKPPQAPDLKRRLLSNLPSLLRWLLPNGVVRTNKFYVGNVHGDKGESLVVELSGDKCGLWHDFASGDGGDIIDLYASVKGFNSKTQFKELLRDIEQHLGAAPPPQRKSCNFGTPTAKWDYTDTQGKLIASVYRYDLSNKKKQFRPWDVIRGVMKAPEVRPLYNQVGIKDSEIVILVEGEKCAEALISIGICATTAMNGAKAPIDKTDWSPLKNKKVIIWPDNDDAGITYSSKAASACARAGAISVEVLKVPPDKPNKWDCADAVAEGLDIKEILTQWERTTVKEKTKRKTLQLYSMAEFYEDVSPMPDDLISPRVLTPGGTLVLGGAPKVGKSDFLISMLAHMAAGKEFLGLKSARPLKIFYLQAEVQYHYLRERLQRLNIPESAMENFISTPQTSITLNDAGIALVVDAVKSRFTPDIIAIDPIRNVFDGGGHGGENDNDAMMFFLSQRIEKLREEINPNAGIILTHHTKKMPKKSIEEDPFYALSGAGSLRSYYTAGMLLYKKENSNNAKNLIFELRNGPEIPNKTIERTEHGWMECDGVTEHVHSAKTSLKSKAIIHLICEEALKEKAYTSNSFAKAFENKAGLGGERSIRDEISNLALQGKIKFFKNAKDYGLPKIQRSKLGYLCVPEMVLNGKPVIPEEQS